MYVSFVVYFNMCIVILFNRISVVHKIKVLLNVSFESGVHFF